MSQELTQTTESSSGPSQTIDMTAKLKAVENRLLEMKADHAAEVSRLQNQVSEFEARSTERAKGWESLQHRYESLDKEYHKIRKERDNLVAEKAKVEQKVTKQEEEIGKLKDERTQLKHEVQSARDDLKAEGGLKEELEKAREEIRQLNEKNAKLERIAERESSQAEYVRNQYQEGSNKVHIMANENKQLRAENEELSRKNAADVTKLREIRMQSDTEKHLARIKQLEQGNETLETLLRKKDEEIRSLRNNRPVTRATSTQPRSPKWGNGSRPTSPGINNNGNNGVGSRGSGLRFSSEMSF